MKQLGLTTGTLISASFKEFLILLKKKFKEGAEIKHIENLVDCKIMECRNWSDYLMIFEKIRPHFIDKLKDKSNNTITSIEMRICSLIKLGFDKYEISGIIGISPRGVEQHRYRINKKFISINSLNKFIDSL